MTVSAPRTEPASGAALASSTAWASIRSCSALRRPQPIVPQCLRRREDQDDGALHAHESRHGTRAHRRSFSRRRAPSWRIPLAPDPDQGIRSGRADHRRAHRAARPVSRRGGHPDARRLSPSGLERATGADGPSDGRGGSCTPLPPRAGAIRGTRARAPRWQRPSSGGRADDREANGARRVGARVRGSGRSRRSAVDREDEPCYLVMAHLDDSAAAPAAAAATAA